MVGAVPGGAITPPPGIEVWELKRDTYRFWERILPTQQQNPPRRNFDKGRAFYFGAQGKKRRKISKKLLGIGDYVVVDTSGNYDVAHYVSRKVLGKNGALYFRVKEKNTQPGATKTTIFKWYPLLGPSKLLSDKHLQHVTGLEGSLMAARPIIDKDRWEQLQNKTVPAGSAVAQFAYTYIRYDQTMEAIFHSEQWTIVEIPDSGGPPVSADFSPKVLKDLVESRALDKFEDAYEEYVDSFNARIEELRAAVATYAYSHQDIEAFNKCMEKLDSLMLEAIPSPLPGTTAAQGSANTLAGLIETHTANNVDPITMPDWLSLDASSITVSSAETIGCLLGIIHDSIEIHQLRKDTSPEARRLIGSKILDLGDKFVKAGKGIIDIAAVAQAAVHGSDNAAATGLSNSSPFIGAVIGYLSAIRMSVKGVRTQVRLAKLDSYMDDVRNEFGKKPKKGKPDVEPRLLGIFIRNKMRRRGRKQWTTVAAGTIGATSGVILGSMAVIGAIGLVNAWNPIGWTLLAASTAIGVGVIAYTSVRHFTKSHRRAHRRDKGHPGSVEEFSNRAMAMLFGRSGSRSHRVYGFKLMRIFGVPVEELKGGGYKVRAKKGAEWQSFDDADLEPVTNQTMQAIRDRIRRHVKA